MDEAKLGLPVRRNGEPLGRAQQRHRATQRHFERLQIRQRGEFRPCARHGLYSDEGIYICIYRESEITTTLPICTVFPPLDFT